METYLSTTSFRKNLAAFGFVAADRPEISRTISQNFSPAVVTSLSWRAMPTA
jgi:hypothetical protein